MKADCVLVCTSKYMSGNYAGAILPIQMAWEHLCDWLNSKSRTHFETNSYVTFLQLDEQPTLENVGEICKSLHDKLESAYRVFIVPGVGAYAGALWYGAAILGDACFEELIELERPTACNTILNGDKWTCSKNGQIGAMLHELGHLYGLEHEDGGFMQHYKTWPDVSVPDKAYEIGMLTRKTPWRSKLLSFIRGWLKI